MTEQGIKAALAAKEKELADAVEQRDRLIIKILTLQADVRALKASAVRTVLAARLGEDLVGLSEAIRSVLRLSSTPMTPGEIKRTLTIMGFDFSRFANGSAAVHNTLKRMHHQGEADYVVNTGQYSLKPAFYGR